MGRILKNNSIHVGKKNVDISNIINNTNSIANIKNSIPNTNTNTNLNLNINQLGGSKKKKSKNTIVNDLEFGSDDNDSDNSDDSEESVDPDETEEQDNVELNNEQNEDNDYDENNNINYSDKSDKESDVGDDDNNNDNNDIADDEKNYIDDEETLKSKCYSKYAEVDNDELDFDELFGDETILLEKNVRISKPVLTKYEFVRLLTDRTKQLAQGAKQMLKNTQDLSSKEITKLEIKEGVIPLIIERPIPNSKSERWKVSELYIPEHFFSM